MSLSLFANWNFLDIFRSLFRNNVVVLLRPSQMNVLKYVLPYKSLNNPNEQFVRRLFANLSTSVRHNRSC